MLIDEINKAKVVAFKNKDEATKIAIGTIKNKFMLAQIEKRAKGEEMTDEDTIQILLKTQKELQEEADNYLKVNNQVEADNVMMQKKAIEQFLPKMLTEEEIREIIATLEDKTIPSIMKHFKTNYAGKVNMADVSKVAKSL